MGTSPTEHRDLYHQVPTSVVRHARWHDVVIAAAQFFFALALFPVMVDKAARVPVATSIGTVLLLAAMCVVFARERKWLSYAGTLCCALVWLAVAVWRH